jgi:hypothetical protein
MYDRGDISAREFTRLMTFCNNPGSAFVISAVGVSLLGNGRLGVLIYVCVILSALVVGFVGQFFFRDGEENQSTSRALAPSANEMAVEVFTRAVSSSASSMLTVCAYVAFFSTLVGCVGHFLSMAGVSATLTAFVFGALEISGGVGAMSALPEPMLAAVGCAAVVGWSGLSVHCQIMSICAGRGVSFKPYFIAKAAQSIVCAAMVAAALLFSRLNGNTGFKDVFLLRGDGDFCGAIWVCITVAYFLFLGPTQSKTLIDAFYSLFGDASLGSTVAIATYVLVNVAFVVYDIALTRLITVYLFRLRKKFRFLK